MDKFHLQVAMFFRMLLFDIEQSHGLLGIAINWTSLDEVGVLAYKKDMVKHSEKTKGLKASVAQTLELFGRWH